MPDADQQTLPSPPVPCAGTVRQREPPIFSGTDDNDVEEWLSSYERVSVHNKWNDSDKLAYVSFYLAGVASLWFRNHERDIRTWSAFKTSITEVFDRPAVRILRAEQRLRTRAQDTGETFTSYIEDVLDLCRRVNAAMTEAEKIKHVMKGIDDDAFQMLLAKDPRTVGDVISLCQSYDELRKQRALTRRHPTPNAASLCSLTTGPEQASLIAQIKDFVREEVARQLSLVSITPESASTLPSPLRNVIHEEVTKALPAVHQQDAVATPLTYAVVAAMAPRSAPVPRFQQPVHRPPPPAPWASTAVANPWRTPDNRLICFACRYPGHVARFCRRRSQAFDDDRRASYVPPDPNVPYGPFDPSPPRSQTDRRPRFERFRSPSPRRRSLSPMRQRPVSNEEGN